MQAYAKLPSKGRLVGGSVQVDQDRKWPAFFGQRGGGTGRCVMLPPRTINSQSLGLYCIEQANQINSRGKGPLQNLHDPMTAVSSISLHCWTHWLRWPIWVYGDSLRTPGAEIRMGISKLF